MKTNKARWEGRTAVLAIVALLWIAMLIVADILYDREAGASSVHLAIEGAVVGIALAGVVALLLRVRALARDHRELRGALRASRREAERWRRETRELLEGLGVAVSRQFDRWQLTPAERDVAALLLRGFSHKEVARERSASERTVRQQAHTVYRKAGLGNRADLAAFFLADLRLPKEE